MKCRPSLSWTRRAAAASCCCYCHSQLQGLQLQGRLLLLRLRRRRLQRLPGSRRCCCCTSRPLCHYCCCHYYSCCCCCYCRWQGRGPRGQYCHSQGNQIHHPLQRRCRAVRGAERRHPRCQSPPSHRSAASALLDCSNGSSAPDSQTCAKVVGGGWGGREVGWGGGEGRASVIQRSPNHQGSFLKLCP